MVPVEKIFMITKSAYFVCVYDYELEKVMRMMSLEFVVERGLCILYIYIYIYIYIYVRICD